MYIEIGPGWDQYPMLRVIVFDCHYHCCYWLLLFSVIVVVNTNY